MYLMKPHDWKSSSSCWITWGLAAVPPLQIPPVPLVFSVCPLHLAGAPACWIQLCLPHVHAHQAGGKPSLLADWARFKSLTVCASRRPLVLVGSDSTVLSASLSCSSRCVCPSFPLGDLPSAPPPFASLSAAFRFTERVEAVRKNCHPLSPAHGPTPASVLLSLWAGCPCFWLRLCWPVCTHFRAFSNTQGHLFSSYCQPFCVIEFFLRLALPPTGASFPSAMLQQNSLK